MRQMDLKKVEQGSVLWHTLVFDSSVPIPGVRVRNIHLDAKKITLSAFMFLNVHSLEAATPTAVENRFVGAQSWPSQPHWDTDAFSLRSLLLRAQKYKKTANPHQHTLTTRLPHAIHSGARKRPRQRLAPTLSCTVAAHFEEWRQWSFAPTHAQTQQMARSQYTEEAHCDIRTARSTRASINT